MSRWLRSATRPWLLLVLAACSTRPDPAANPTPPPARSDRPIVLSRQEDGLIVLCDPTTLAERRRWTGGPAPAPMLIANDARRRCSYVGNFRGGIARVPWEGGDPGVLPMPAPVIGLAIDKTGAVLAANGAFDLRLRLVDLHHWLIGADIPLSDPKDAPRHSHLTHGLKSTHPAFELDGSAVVTQDNVHEQVLRIRDGRVVDAVQLPAAVHALLPRPGGGWVAIGEGAVDGSVPPFVACLAASDLHVERLVPLPLFSAEKAKLHHGEIAPDGSVVVVANMGPMHGAGGGQTVHAVDLQQGTVRWSRPGPRNAGHVRFVAADTVVVLGHRDGRLFAFDVADGSVRSVQPIDGVAAFGHAIEREADGALLVVDSGNGRLLRVRDGAVVASSAAYGAGTWEASLRE